ncbi:MAG: DUF86 domain-containing protein [Bacteroidetes bacterium]|nr:DUF86 domain-containing protein [Bacteroidota bacterium]
MNDTLSDEVRLKHILDSIKNIQSFTKGFDEHSFLKSQLVQSAVERQLEIIGEAASKLTEEIKEKYNYIEWFKIKAFRNIIAHEYFGVSKIQVWGVVYIDLPKLKKQVREIIKDI